MFMLMIILLFVMSHKRYVRAGHTEFVRKDYLTVHVCVLRFLRDFLANKLKL